MGVAAAEFTEGRFADDDGAGFFELGDDEGIAAGIIIFEQQRAQSRRHRRRVALVLHDDRYAVQRPHRTRGLVRGVEAVGFCERVGIERNDRIDRRAIFVIGGDAIEIHLHQLTAGQLAGSIGGVDLVDGGFENIKSHGRTPLRF